MLQSKITKKKKLGDLENSEVKLLELHTYYPSAPKVNLSYSSHVPSPTASSHLKTSQGLFLSSTLDFSVLNAEEFQIL